MLSARVYCFRVKEKKRQCVRITASFGFASVDNDDDDNDDITVSDSRIPPRGDGGRSNHHPTINHRRWNMVGGCVSGERSDDEYDDDHVVQPNMDSTPLR